MSLLGPLAVLIPLTLASLAQQHALTRPIPAYDETHYYRAGAAIWHGIIPPGDYSPGYAALYGIFASPGATPSAAYHAMRLCLALLTVSLTYIAVHRIRGPFIGLCCAGMLAASVSLATVMTLYCASAVVVALALTIVGPSPRRAGGALLVLACGIAIRPEFAFVTVAAAVTCFGLIRPRLRWYLPAAAMACAIIVYTMLAPVYTGDGPEYAGRRLMYAFCQHYGWTQYDLNTHVVPLRLLKSKMDHCDDVLRRDFGSARTITAALRANPHAFLRHVGHNIVITPVQTLAMLELQIGDGVPGLVPACIWLGLAVGALIRPRRRRRSSVRQAAAPQLWIVVSACTLFLPWMVIRPRYDYQVALLPAFALTLALFIAVIVPRESPTRGRLA